MNKCMITLRQSVTIRHSLFHSADSLETVDPINMWYLEHTGICFRLWGTLHYYLIQKDRLPKDKHRSLWGYHVNAGSTLTPYKWAEILDTPTDRTMLTVSQCHFFCFLTFLSPWKMAWFKITNTFAGIKQCMNKQRNKYIKILKMYKSH